MKKLWIGLIFAAVFLAAFWGLILIALLLMEGTVKLSAAETPVAPAMATPTPFQPATPTPVVVAPTQPAAPVTESDWIPYESEGGIPYNGMTWSVDVAPDELEVFTAGPVCVVGVCLPGGTERGSVIVFLPGAEVTHYEVIGVIAGSNWHGSYRPLGDPILEATWRSLAENRIAAMMEAPNCTPGTGCVIVDVLIVGPSGVIAQWVVNK